MPFGRKKNIFNLFWNSYPVLVSYFHLLLKEKKTKKNVHFNWSKDISSVFPTTKQKAQEAKSRFINGGIQFKSLFLSSLISETLGKCIVYVWRKTVTFLRRSKSRIESLRSTKPVPFSTPLYTFVRFRLAFDLPNNSQIFGRRKNYILYFQSFVHLRNCRICFNIFFIFTKISVSANRSLWWNFKYNRSKY